MHPENSWNFSHTFLKNSKVFEQKGDFLSFKVNIYPAIMLSCGELSQARLS